MDASKIGAKIRMARKYHRPALTQDGLAEVSGVSRAMVASLESGRRTPTSDSIGRIARALQVPIEWFFSPEEGPPPLPPVPAPYGSGIGQAPPAPSHFAHREPEPSVGRRKFPLLGMAGAASFPMASEDPWPGDFVEFADDLFRPERFGIQVKGDSMHPRVEHGDFVLVQPDKELHIGILTIARSAEHEYCVKVPRRAEAGVALHPLNPDYPVLIPGEGWEVVGYAVGRRQERGRGRYLEEGDNAGLRP